MYELSVNFDKCQGCMNCEILLPTFRNIHGGRLRISKRRLEDEEIREAAYSVLSGCKNGAIKLIEMGD